MKVAKRQKKLANGKLGQPESSLPLKMDAEMELTDNVRAYWSDELYWDIPTLTYQQLKNTVEDGGQRAAAIIDLKGKDGKQYKLQEKKQGLKCRPQYLLCVMVGPPFKQVLQLVVTGLVGEDKEKAVEGMRNICEKLATQEIDKLEAEEMKLSLKHLRQKASAATDCKKEGLEDEDAEIGERAEEGQPAAIAEDDDEPADPEDEEAQDAKAERVKAKREGKAAPTAKGKAKAKGKAAPKAKGKAVPKKKAAAKAEAAVEQLSAGDNNKKTGHEEQEAAAPAAKRARVTGKSSQKDLGTYISA